MYIMLTTLETFALRNFNEVENIFLWNNEIIEGSFCYFDDDSSNETWHETSNEL